MNGKLQNFARGELKKGLLKCNEKMQHLFKQMYSGGRLDMHIDDVVDNMPEEKLDWAMQQVEKTLAKIGS